MNRRQFLRMVGLSPLAPAAAGCCTVRPPAAQPTSRPIDMVYIADAAGEWAAAGKWQYLKDGKWHPL